MGLIKSVLSFVGSLFGGIFKLFGLGKKDGFFMEFDESSSEEPSTETAAAPAPAAAKLEESSAAPMPADSSVATAPSSLTPEQLSNSPSLNPDKPLVLPKSPAELQAKAESRLTNFATDFLVNPKLSNSSRRRPGPSLSAFKDMAKQVG